MADEEKPSVGRLCLNFFKFHWQGVLTFLTPFLYAPILIAEGLEFRCLYLILVMATYWIAEVIPLFVTSMIPIVALPIMGIADSNKVCMQYFKDPLVMFLGGLIVSLAIEYSDLHKRVALGTILIVGCSPRRLLFGLICVTSFISMWISNAAATAMMCPIIKAVLDELQTQNVVNIYAETDDKEAADSTPRPSKIAMCYYLSAAYAASIGGCGTLIGTGTNITFKGIYDDRFPDATDKIDFPVFMAYGTPLVIVFTAALIFSMLITHMGLFRPNSKEGKEVAAATENSIILKNVIKQKFVELGALTMHEFQVIIVFVCMIVFLFTRKPGFTVGWADVMNAKVIKTSCPVMLCVIMLFYCPMNYKFCKLCGGSGPFEKRETPSTLGWAFVQKQVPWGLLFLLGGGFALALGSTESGMAKMLGNALKGLVALPTPVVQFLVIIFAMFLTMFSSNVAIANILVPVLNEMAIAIKVHPLYLVLPGGIACSYAFHLPVSTPPNAIVAGYANIGTKYMFTAGLLPSFWGIVLLALNANFWHPVVFPGGTGLPDWAKATNST